MKEQDKNTTFEATFWSESDKSIAVLVIKGNSEGTMWNTLEWFPKKSCLFGEKGEYGRLNVTAPDWLLKIKGIQDKITVVN